MSDDTAATGLTGAERAALNEVLTAEWPDDTYERGKFLERTVENLLAARAVPTPSGDEQRVVSWGHALGPDIVTAPQHIPPAPSGAEAALERVRALHHEDGEGFCHGCGYGWPCDTARALAPSAGPDTTECGA